MLSFEAKEVLISFYAMPISVLDKSELGGHLRKVENRVFAWCFSNEEMILNVITGLHNYNIRLGGLGAPSRPVECCIPITASLRASLMQIKYMCVNMLREKSSC